MRATKTLKLYCALPPQLASILELGRAATGSAVAPDLSAEPLSLRMGSIISSPQLTP